MSGLDPNDPLRVLLSGIIDYAGLFPPADLALPRVLQNFAAYRRAPESWMLARVVIPAGKLAALPEAAEGLSPGPGSWGISALVPAPGAGYSALRSAVESIRGFNAGAGRFATVETVEGRADTLAMLAESVPLMPAGLPVFWELPHAGDVDPLIAALGELRSPSNGASGYAGQIRHMAKIRTGGTGPEQIPPTAEVARFIHSCAAHQVAFKATAGLHHPVRSMQALTYAADAPRAVMHGFLNVFLAATAAWTQQATPGQIEDILLAAHQESFVLKSEVLGVGEYEFTSAELARTRAEFAVSFGSCSFLEPIDDLQNMDWLPVSSGT